MQNSANNPQDITSPRGSLQQYVRRLSSKKSQTTKGQHSSPIVFPDKRGKAKSLKKSDADVANEDLEKVKPNEHRIDIGDEKSDLLGYEVFSGKLALDKKAKSVSVNEQTGSRTGNPDKLEAKLTSKALIWGSSILNLDDIISVSYCAGLRHFTVHAYPTKRRSCGLSCVLKPQRVQRDFRFLASNSEEAVQWIQGFADQQCFVNCLPHPMMSNKKQESDILSHEPLYDIPYIKCRSPPSLLVILNPRSGHGRSSKVFHGKVEPIFKLAGFKMEVVKTTYAGHAKNLASTVDFSMCPDGIVCVGGDGIVNEVLNGLLSRENQKESISIPIGVIPAGSDNSLIWTVLGIRDPISAAMAIVKGGLTATDVLTVKWIQNGITHYGTTVSYFGFLSDVLELSEKYQKRFGPLRYFVAGFLKFLCLPKYNFDLEYLPKAQVINAEGKSSEDQQKIDMSDFYTEIMQRSRKEGLTRASSLSSIDSIMSPSRMSGGDVDATGSTIASSEPSEYVRGLNPKVKRLSLGRSNLVAEPDEVLHPQPHLSVNSNWPRTRSKSRTDRSWTGMTATTDARCSWAPTALYDKEDISSTISDPGPIWDAEPKWDTEPNWETGNPIELSGPPDDIELGLKKELVPSLDEKWVVKKGQFLAVLVCNHSCKTVQSLSSQVVAPKAEHDDNSLDLLLINGSGRMRLLRFFMYLQFGRHLSLPYVDYVKVRSVKLRPAANTNCGCGIDGELIHVDGQAFCSLLPDQFRLIGRPAKDRA